MLLTCSRVIALIAVVSCLSMKAQAADTTLTLACQGTVTNTTQPDAKPEPISTGVIINFTARTIEGTNADPRFFGGVHIRIWHYDENTIRFGRSGDEWHGPVHPSASS
jgi:hypothetical protein